jgi:voltage-dependent potassium channel beta subunit
MTEMKYRSIGRCGTKISILSLGGWTTYGESVTDDQTIHTILHKAFDAGINFFDIADIYNRGQNEMAMGKVLKDFPRHELVVSSKVFFPMSDDVNDRGLSRKHIMESIDKSLNRIGTDYLDIYFCHRYDEKTPLEETCRAMDDLVHRGKILYWGTSDWTGEQLRNAHEICEKYNLYKPQVEQPRYHLCAREKFETDVAPAVNDLGMGIVTFSPLVYGILTGKYDDGIPPGSRLERIDWLKKRYYCEEVLERVRKMKPIADELGCTRAQLAIAWIMSHPNVTSVITGATKIEQFEDNIQALSVNITDEIKQKLEGLHPLVW